MKIDKKLKNKEVESSVDIKDNGIFAAEEDEAPVFDFGGDDDFDRPSPGGMRDTDFGSDFDDESDEDFADDEESEEDDEDFVIEEDDIGIENENNISGHYIAECDVCKGIFISAIVESDQVVESINGVCPICNKKSEQFLKWVVKDV